MTYREIRIRLANRIKQLRAEQNISLLRMEEGRFGLHRRTVQDAENPEKDVRLKTLVKLSKRLNVELVDLFK